MLDPSGQPMCRMAAKRGRWYLAKGLASLLPEGDPLAAQAPGRTIRLHFEPGGPGNAAEPHGVSRSPAPRRQALGQEEAKARSAALALSSHHGARIPAGRQAACSEEGGVRMRSLLTAVLE
ncbi:hypothetical protein EMIHUDRAFT_198887 [Emiliania huxleyi CCMP1516]|uniref:Uncharacterized protein n=2 Tax=Emiliania huxleyi TaxID=2903 RepID=A0A0D3I1Y0_EMIH1|nr:hypothetical protein EMIHUDRAFT_198887 [Emiliania huxleyi CCMP1516]EOD05265.1 hypothetical protein EMIHUDRAFT_198887 [Emiliania huxleyi CCMP1516]|eukprot:XP_005757694.1 hypothetical protein EMIHUDRAFT_198887 [Emiliania huxleyi CCMP1516]